ncbi:MAG: protein kinase [Acidobacteriota bacterium]|nr:protein kinase [Acidobacteriota bacterium]
MGKFLKCPRCHSDNPESSRFCNDCGSSLDGKAAPDPKVQPSFTKTLDTPTPALKKGTLFANKYKIGGEIGRGGMGVVFKAEDAKLKRSVALKLLPLEQSQSPEAKERFMREAQAAAALDHPHICTVYEVEEQDGQMYIAMAFIDGMSLKARIVRKPLEVAEAMDIALQVAEGLGEAHRKGVVHRDIKPANIMLAARGGVKIMDFGLARLAGAGDLTRTDAVMGTVAYMSPEQALGQKVDHRTDIWSFGCLVYEMLAGQGPFQGGHEQAVFQAIVHGEPEPIAALRSDIPAGLAGVLEQCLQKSALNRYLDFQALIQDLKAVDLRVIASAPAPSSHKPSTSIAVLPFTNMSSEKEQDYFAEGIAEELLNALAHIHDLRVVARTSAFAFKGKDIDIREIGRKLNVKSVLEGSVRKAGNRLRITAQLINVEDGFHLWSERYDRDMADIFAIQDEITTAIVDSLKVTLKVGEKTALRKRSTENIEAYNLYLQGVHFWNKRTPEGVKKGMIYFREAIEKDPGFALAYAGLANSYNVIGYYGPLSPREAFPQARDLALKALELDEYLAEAHTALGTALGTHYWDWAGAENAFKRAIELNPGYPSARQLYGIFLMFVGRYDEAIQELRKGQELDPVSASITWVLGIAFAHARHYDRAIREYKKAMELDPAAYLPYLWTVFPYSMKGMHEEAIAAAKRMLELLGEEISPWNTVLAQVHAAAGNQDEARRILTEVIALSEKRYVSPAYIAGVYRELNERDKAFEWLHRAYEERDHWLLTIIARPGLDNLREDPRAKALLRKMGLE